MIQYLYLLVYIMLGFSKLASPESLETSELSAATAAEMAAKVDSLHFLNPVFADDWAEPTVWQSSDGDYYSFSATALKSNMRPIKSSDLIHWQTVKQPLIPNRFWTYLEAVGKHLSSPQVVKIGGQWRMYLSASNSADDSNIIALAEDAMQPGQFKYKNRLIVSKEVGIKDCVDPFVVEDDVTHKIYLFFGATSGIYRVELSADGLNLAEGAVPARVAGLDISVDRQRSKVFQAAFVHKHQDYWYLFVSCGHYNSSSSNILVGRSRTLDGMFVDKQGMVMYDGHASAVFAAEDLGDYFYGPGNAGGIISDREGRDFLFYNCHNTEAKGTSTYNPRPLMMQQIIWDNQGWPSLQIGLSQWLESRPAL